MRAHRRGRFIGKRAPLLALAASGILMLGSTPAMAEDPDPITQIEEALAGESGDSTSTETTAEDGATEDGATENEELTVVEDDDPNKEMSDPESPDHASADNAEVKLADEDVAKIGQTDATIGDDDSASADATALSLGGNEIVGAHAEGNESNSAGDPLEPICSGSEGALCAQVLYAEASSSERDGAQHSESHTSVANACVGGTDAEPEDCDGPVGASVLKSDSEIDRGADGTTEASSSSQAAGVCLSQDPLLGCTIGAEAVSSEGQSHSDGTSNKDSQIVGLTLPAEFAPLSDPLNEAFSEPQAIEIPPECPADAHVACLFFNQGETYIGSAGHAVTALDATLLNGTVLATLSHSETLANKFPADEGGGGGGGGGDGDGGEATGGGAAQGGEAASGGVLPNTGGIWSGFLSLALLGVGVGSFLVAWSRRSALAAAGVHGAA